MARKVVTARRLGILTALILGLTLAACETESATEVGYNAAMLHGKGACQGTYSVEWWYAYRAVSEGSWSQGPHQTVSCTGQTPTGDLVAYRARGLADATPHEFRIEYRQNGGPVRWRDATGAEGGTNYDRFTTGPHPTVTPTAAATFRDSVGINTRTAFTGTPYQDYPALKLALAYTGIRHLRDSLHPPNISLPQRAFYKELHRDLGVDVTVGVDDFCTGIREERLSELAGDAELRAAIGEIEAPNEVDLPGTPNFACYTPALVRQRQRELWDRIKGSSLFAHWPVIGMSFAKDGWREAGDLSAWLNFGNMHPYPGGDPPEKDALNVNFNVCRATAGPSKPCRATEAGYHTDTTFTTDLNRGVSEQVQASYTLRLLLEFYRRGVPRTDLFWLAPKDCDGNNGNRTSSDYSIYDCQWQPKPAATALHNLTSAIGAGAGAPNPLKVALDTGPTDLRQVLLRRSDGAYLLALWRTASLWDRGDATHAGQPIAVTPARVELSVPEATAVRRITPVTSAQEVPIPIQNGGVSVDLAGDPIVLRISR